MKNIITSEIVVAYSQCKLKAYLLLCTSKLGETHEYISILQKEAKKNKENYLSKLREKNPDVVLYSSEGMKQGESIMLDATLVFDDLEAHADVLTKVEEISSQRRHNFIPTLVVGTYKISKEQKLQIAFIDYVLSKLRKEKPATGIIVDRAIKSHKTKLEPLYKEIRQILKKLREWTSVQEPESPPVILNKHCSLCQFQKKCEIKAKEQDHLSLLKGMSEKEILAQSKKGIFTVTQFSYTYRARRRRKGKKDQPLKYFPSLRALAIRDEKIYVVEKPEIPQLSIQMYLDVEGIPDQDFYYLIGLVVTDGISTKNFSFWADNQDEEEKVWTEFLSAIRVYNDYVLFHYGTYETKFVRNMILRYGKDQEDLLNRIQSNMVNAISLIYTKIYFPTYSNSLKDIGSYLGSKWSQGNASGLQSLVWRYRWQNTKGEKLKQILLQYNLEDCLALKNLIISLEVITSRDDRDTEGKICLVDHIKPESTYHFGKVQFVLEDLDFINRCSYFDYQRDKVYFRTEKWMKRGNTPKKTQGANKVNKYIKIETDTCKICGSLTISPKKYKGYKFLFDLRFFKGGVKKWLVRYSTFNYRCNQCKKLFIPDEYVKIKKIFYGYELMCWFVYQYVTKRQTYQQIQSHLYDIYSLSIPLMSLYDLKSEAVNRYQFTYQSLLKKLVLGNLIHADETQVRLRKEEGYVWVFTSMKEVMYLYTPTREGSFLKEMLENFCGVLVSDFYPGYDSLNCPQQKCLVHLIRDLNNDLYKNPFNGEYKNLVTNFTSVLKKIVHTMDQYGLKKRYLNKHKKDVKHFYNQLLNKEYSTDLAKSYQKRFKKNERKLFTFLDYDGIPWNNNNAEHAIKTFARHRNIFNGQVTENGITEYLILLSIYQTCVYREIDFLTFLKSKETDIDSYFLKNQEKMGVKQNRLIW
jgi:predicted RecB family nuclease